MNVQPIQAIEEVNMFKEDGNVIHFANPRGKLPIPPYLNDPPKKNKKPRGPGEKGKTSKLTHTR